MKFNIFLTLLVVVVTNEASGGVIEGVYNKVSNTTQAVKDDVYSWWSYGVDTVMGTDSDATIDESGGNCKNETWLIGKLYNRVRGGVSAGYMRVHDYVLGEDSDPNKGIIKTFYERALKRLSNIKSIIFGTQHSDEKPASHTNEDGVKQEVLKLLFSNQTNIFNTQSEKSALDSLRNKLTQKEDEIIHLADDERDLLRKAYESVRRKSDEILTNIKESADNAKNKVNENIEKSQEFVRDESKKVNNGAQHIREEVKQSADDTATSVRSKSDEMLTNVKESADNAKNKINENIEKTQEFIRDESKKVNNGAQHIREEVKQSADDIATSVRSKSDEMLTNVKESADNAKNKINENIEKTQEFIRDESKKVNNGAQHIREEVKQSADDIAKKMQSAYNED